MTVGIDCRLLNKVQNTGISRYTEFLISYYISKVGAENIFLITNDQNFYYVDCKVIYTPLRPYNIYHFFKYASFVEKLRFDLLHIPFYSGPLRKNKKLKVIVTVHDLMYRFVKGFFGSNYFLNKLKILYFDFIVKNTLNNADVIVSVSETTKNDVFKTFKLKSIHIPEDSEIKENSNFSFLDVMNLSKGNFFFYCGNNRPHKNIDFIINIFNNNLNLPPLVLAGKGHVSSRNVIATGIVSDEQLYSLYKSAIAFIFPSSYEGFGLPVLEALRSETLVVASKIPAFLEFKTENIFFFDLKNENEFLGVLQKVMTKKFIIDKSFLSYYDKNRIHQLYDNTINTLFKN